MLDLAAGFNIHRNPKFHTRKATAHRGMNQRLEALHAYGQALRVSPGYPAAVQGLEELDDDDDSDDDC